MYCVNYSTSTEHNHGLHQVRWCCSYLADCDLHCAPLEWQSLCQLGGYWFLFSCLCSYRAAGIPVLRGGVFVFVVAVLAWGAPLVPLSPCCCAVPAWANWEGERGKNRSLFLDLALI